MSKESHPPGTLCLILIGIVGIVLSTSCTGSDPKKLTRDRARELLIAHENFSKPYVIRLEGSEKFLVPAESADEPPPDDRAVALFYQDYPLSSALHQLGLVEAGARVVKRPEVLDFTGHVTAWEYKIETRLTAKGEEQADNAKNGLPLYRREVTEVTGVTAGQTGRARADFKWRRVPTPVGVALEVEGATFKSLPVKIQEGIRKSISRFGNALPVSYKGVQSGHAEFQLYDDGWQPDLIQL
jgi:hypothetical protein